MECTLCPKNSAWCDSYTRTKEPYLRPSVKSILSIGCANFVLAAMCNRPKFRILFSTGLVKVTYPATLEAAINYLIEDERISFEEILMLIKFKKDLENLN